MPNALDAEPVRLSAGRAAALIPDAAVAARYQRLAVAYLFADERNFRPAQAGELASAPPWAGEAHARGEEVSVFKLHPSAAARIRMVARRLALTCALAAVDPQTHRAYFAAIVAAGVFLRKFERANFDVAARKALYFSRVYATIEDERDAVELAPAAEIAATAGRVWRRVRSVSELREIGREFHNCLARTARYASYGGALHRGAAQFWVLRGPGGAGLIVAMAEAPTPKRFGEVRGPRNAVVSGDSPDLAVLARALGFEQPGPTPPPPREAGAGELVLEWLRLADRAAPPLRRRAWPP